MKRATLKYVYTNHFKDWNWELVNKDGILLSKGPGGYCSKRSAMRGFIAVRKHLTKGGYIVKG